MSYYAGHLEFLIETKNTQFEKASAQFAIQIVKSLDLWQYEIKSFFSKTSNLLETK
jgi:hypothetical protein